MPQTRTCWRGVRAVKTMPDLGAVHENEAAFDVGSCPSSLRLIPAV